MPISKALSREQAVWWYTAISDRIEAPQNA
jgi:hypothetical protein